MTDRQSRVIKTYADPMDNNEDNDDASDEITNQKTIKRLSMVHNYVKEILLFTIAILELVALILEYQHGHFTN